MIFDLPLCTCLSMYADKDEWELRFGTQGTHEGQRILDRQLLAVVSRRRRGDGMRARLSVEVHCGQIGFYVFVRERLRYVIFGDD